MSKPLSYPPTPISRRLTEAGLVDVADWQTSFPAQVTGRIPPRGQWFYYRERSGSASIEIFPPGRYPFALPGSSASAGFDPMALLEEPPVEWEYDCVTPPSPSDVDDLTVKLVLQFVEMWRSGHPGAGGGARTWPP